MYESLLNEKKVISVDFMIEKKKTQRKEERIGELEANEKLLIERIGNMKILILKMREDFVKLSTSQ